MLLVSQHGPEERETFSPSLLEFCARARFTIHEPNRAAGAIRLSGTVEGWTAFGAKKLERLRAVGRFLVDRGWWAENLALKLKRPKVKEAPTMPHSHKEMASLLAACDKYTDWHGHAGQENAR